MFSIKDKRQDIRFTKQISVTRISNLPSKFHVLLIFWRKGTLTEGAKWLSGGGAPWGLGGFGPLVQFALRVEYFQLVHVSRALC
jgi:hypothetical protein